MACQESTHIGILSLDDKRYQGQLQLHFERNGAEASDAGRRSLACASRRVVSFYFVPAVRSLKGCVMDRLTDWLFSKFQMGVMIWVDNGKLHYRNPPGALGSDDIIMLREMKQDIITVLTERQSDFRASPELQHRTGSDVAPLTLQQEWYFSHLNDYKGPATTLTPASVPIALRLLGSLDVGALGKSLNMMLRRHESLRTRMAVVGATPLQRIDRANERQLPVIDCNGNSLDGIEERARGAVKEFFSKPLDLMTGPTLDLRLMRLGDSDHVMALLWDHFIMDRTSVVLFFQELWTLYADIRLGRPLSNQQEPTQYADYAVWQRKRYPLWLREQSDYWRATLAGSALLQIPMDSGLSDMEPETGGVVQFSLDRALKNSLLDLAKLHRSSPGMIMLSVLSILALRLCNQRDFLIPLDVSGRRYPEDSDVIGLFSGPLLLRIQLSGSETFVETLKSVSNVFLTANEHLDYAQNLIKGAAFRGSMVRWYPWAFNLDMSARPPEDQQAVCPIAAPFAVEPEKSADSVATFKWPEPNKWNLALYNMPESIDGALFYRADLFKRATVERIVRSLQSIAEQVVVNPHARLFSLSCCAT